jgi:hypothetical protein
VLEVVVEEVSEEVGADKGCAGEGWARGGLIPSFNICIPHAKKTQNEERGTSPIFFFGTFLFSSVCEAKNV